MREYLTFDDIQILPKNSEVLSRSMCDIKGSITKKVKIDVPIISAPMDTVSGYNMTEELSHLGSISCIHRFMSIKEQVSIIDMMNNHFKPKGSGFFREHKTQHTVVAVGVTGDWQERLEAIYEAGCRIVCLDVAHGDHILIKQAIWYIKLQYPDLEIIAGNIATADAALRLIDWGADSLRVGIGGGSLCETRIRTGVGVPMVTCLLDVCEVAQKLGVPVIADGGIRTPGDVCKALACGASSVMLGSLLAGTKESPGEILGKGEWPNEIKFKSYRGSASSESKAARGESGHVEGNSTLIPYKGKVGRIINDISDGIKSSFSYTGSVTLGEFHKNAELIRITGAGAVEARPHLIK